MTFFQHKNAVSDQSSLGGSTINGQRELLFEMEIPTAPVAGSSQKDVKHHSTPGHRPARWLRTLLPLALCVLIGPLSLGLLYRYYVIPAISEVCVPMNRNTSAVKMACDTYPLWTSLDTLFQVNIRSGYVSFTAAKVIDMVWDTVIGRGGQFILMWIAYRVYTEMMTSITEHESVDLEFFASTMLFGYSVSTFTHSAQTLFSGMSRKTSLMLLWMILATSYIFVFPTLLSALTSYMVASSPIVSLIGGTIIPIETYLDSAAYAFINHGIAAESSPWYVRVALITTLPENDFGCDVMMLSRTTYSVGGANLTVDGIG